MSVRATGKNVRGDKTKYKVKLRRRTRHGKVEDVTIGVWAKSAGEARAKAKKQIRDNAIERHPEYGKRRAKGGKPSGFARSGGGV